MHTCRSQGQGGTFLSWLVGSSLSLQCQRRGAACHCFPGWPLASHPSSGSSIVPVPPPGCPALVASLPPPHDDPRPFPFKSGGRARGNALERPGAGPGAGSGSGPPRGCCGSSCSGPRRCRPRTPTSAMPTAPCSSPVGPGRAGPGWGCLLPTSIRLSVHPCVRLSLCRPPLPSPPLARLSVCLSVTPAPVLPGHPSVCLSLAVSAALCIYRSLRVAVRVHPAPVCSGLSVQRRPSSGWPLPARVPRAGGSSPARPLSSLQTGKLRQAQRGRCWEAQPRFVAPGCDLLPSARPEFGPGERGSAHRGVKAASHS